MCHIGQVKRCDQDVTKLQNGGYIKVDINIITKQQDVTEDKLLATTRNIKNWAGICQG